MEIAGRLCRRCGATKRITDFPRNRAQPTGRAYYCRECARQITADWRRRNPEAIEAYRAARRQGPIQKTCRRCGASFIQDGQVRWYCSRECFRTRRRIP
jgi:hypothetical protein